MSGINDPNRPGYVRAPLLRVLLDGNPIPGALDASWNATSHLSPSTWHASFALGADPRYGLRWFDKIEAPAFVDIQAGFGGTGGVQWASLGIGHMDDITADLEAGTVHISGRDCAAILIETPTAETFQNQSSAQMVQTIAGRHRLGFMIGAATTLNERFYGSDHTKSTHGRAAKQSNEWDLLTHHAQQDGFDLFMLGKVLHYQPLPALTDKPYVLAWNAATATAATPSSNGIGIHLDHKMMLKRAVTVVVKSFHSRTGRTVVARGRSRRHGAAPVSDTTIGTATGGGGAPTSGNVNGAVFTASSLKPKTYTFIRPNLTQAQANALAASLLADIMKHERNVSWSEPATGLLTPRNVMRLEGTASDFDQAYYVETVETKLGFNGFTMDVRAKSHSAATTQDISDATTD